MIWYFEDGKNWRCYAFDMRHGIELVSCHGELGWLYSPSKDRQNSYIQEAILHFEYHRKVGSLDEVPNYVLKKLPAAIFWQIKKKLKDARDMV